MKFYLVFNGLINQPFELTRFVEDFEANGRMLEASVKIEDVDATLANLTPYLQKNSVNKISVLNENEVEIYKTTAFTEIHDFRMQLNFEQENGIEDGPITYGMTFSTVAE